MKKPSTLGFAIEAAIGRHPRCHRYREPVQYLCCYRTSSGRVFAHERVTKSQITLWLPLDDAVCEAAERNGLAPVKSLPSQDQAATGRYGRIHSLKSVPELRDAALYRIAVTDVGQALAVVEALA
jgi:hypothetical protein